MFFNKRIKKIKGKHLYLSQKTWTAIKGVKDVS